MRLKMPLRFSLAPVLVSMVLALGGCALFGYQNTFHWQLLTNAKPTNLYGCPRLSSAKAFWYFDVRVLRDTPESMSFSFDVFDPPMSLVMGFKRTDSGEDSKGRMLTLDRAIIVRVPEEVFDDPNAVMKSEDPARLLSLLDAGGGELNVVTLFGSGNAVYGSNGLSEVTLDLQSECPVPLYRGYIKQMVGFGVRDAHFGECLEEKMPEGPATIRGKFHGQWVRDWKPPI